MRTYAVSPTRSRRRQDALPGAFYGAVGLPAQQLRQLRHVCRHPPRLILGEVAWRPIVAPIILKRPNRLSRAAGSTGVGDHANQDAR